MRKLKKRKISALDRKYLIVRKNYGWYHRKYGIVLDYLNDTQIKLLKENKFIRDISNDEQVMYIIFQALEMEHHNKSSRKVWYNPYTDTVTDYKTLVLNSKNIEWKCAICKDKIISKIDYFEISNFLCDECKPFYDKQKERIDIRIVESSMDFLKNCKLLLKKEQNSFVKYIKKNKKNSN